MLPMILPSEVWHHILSFLPLTDLKTVMLVCKDFSSVCARKSLWRNVILNKQKLSKCNSDMELAMIEMKRFNFKHKINIKDYIDESEDMEEVQKQNIIRNIFRYCCSKEHVNELSMETANLSQVGICLLISSILKLQTINFRFSSIDENELTIILSMIPYSQSLKSINLSYMNLSNISPQLLHKVAKCLEKVSLNQSNLTVEQCKNLLHAIKMNPKMSTLGLGGQQSLRLLPEEMLMNMITHNMKCLDLSDTNLNHCQLEIILKQISKLTSMTTLDLKNSVFSKVDTLVVADALSNIEDLGLMQTEFGTGQLDALFKQILHKQKTKEINLYSVNLKEIEKNLFAEALRTIKLVVLSFTVITYDQAVSLLAAIRQGSKIRTLYMNHDLLCNVDNRLLCGAIASLEYVCMMIPQMNRKMVMEIISQALKAKRKTKMMSPGILLANVRPSKFHLMTANLNKEQLKQLLPEYAKAGVQELKLNNTNFTEMDIESLISIIPSLSFLDVSFSKFTADQLTTLLHTVKNAQNLEELVLSGIDLSSVSLQMVKESICNIKTVSLQKNFFDKMSEVELLREALMNSKIMCLKLRYLKMKSLYGDYRLVCENFNSVQATMLLEMVKDNPIVKELIITGDDLSQIDEELLFHAVSKLESVSLIGTHLTDEQLVSIVSAATGSDSLKSLNLSSNNLSKLSPDLLVSATENLAVLSLESSSLTQQQCRDVIIGATKSSTMKFLNLNLVGAEWNFSLTPNLTEDISVVLKHAQRKEELHIKWNFYSQW